MIFLGMTTSLHFTQTYIFVVSVKVARQQTLIYNILKHCTDKKTNVVFSVAPFIEMLLIKKYEMLEKKNVNTIVYDHFIDGK